MSYDKVSLFRIHRSRPRLFTVVAEIMSALTVVDQRHLRRNYTLSLFQI